VSKAVRQAGISDAGYYHWRRGYGGLRQEQTRRHEDLEAETRRLKRLAAELSLDKAMLAEVAKGNF
jgi:hypothetical protein